MYNCLGTSWNPIPELEWKKVGTHLIQDTRTIALSCQTTLPTVIGLIPPSFLVNAMREVPKNRADFGGDIVQSNGIYKVIVREQEGPYRPSLQMDRDQVLQY